MDDKKLIHLYILDRCSHHCALCCNKQYNTMEIPVVTVEELQYADTVCLTGGEPFLLDCVCNLAEDIKRQYPNIKQIYVYTCGDSLHDWLHRNDRLHGIDGVNISPKNKYDCECVTKIFENEEYKKQILGLWSNRLYLFPNVKEWGESMKHLGEYECMNVIDRMWQKEFKPDSGIFRRLPILMG